jgi:hypothetical protein
LLRFAQFVANRYGVPWAKSASIVSTGVVISRRKIHQIADLAVWFCRFRLAELPNQKTSKLALENKTHMTHGRVNP